MQSCNVVNIQRISAEDRAKIEAVDPAIRIHRRRRAGLTAKYRETWPAFSSARYLAPGAAGSGTREERDRLLADAEVILGGWPFPLDLRARAPRLKWFHQRPAGASNLLRGDLWGSDVTVTTSRGSGNTLAMAEYAVAGILHFAKGLHRAVDRSRRGRVQPARISAAAAGGQDRLRRRRRRHRARGRPALRRARHAGRRHPPPPAARTGPCRRDSASLAAPGISIGSCRTAISW